VPQHFYLNNLPQSLRKCYAVSDRRAGRANQNFHNISLATDNTGANTLGHHMLAMAGRTVHRHRAVLGHGAPAGADEIDDLSQIEFLVFLLFQVFLKNQIRVLTSKPTIVGLIDVLLPHRLATSVHIILHLSCPTRGGGGARGIGAVAVGGAVTLPARE